jgi:hypothetical protein
MTTITKIAIFYSKKNLFGIMCRLFTGSFAYHVGIIHGEYLYEIHMLLGRRRILIKDIDPRKRANMRLFDSPVEISQEYLDREVLNANKIYGFVDYFLFGFRWIPGLRNRLRDTNGVICSEMVNDDLIAHGWESPWRDGTPPPSPSDLYKLLGDSAK